MAVVGSGAVIAIGDITGNAIVIRTSSIEVDGVQGVAGVTVVGSGAVGTIGD